MIQTKCQIVEKRQISEDVYKMVFENAVIASKAKPGQFIHLNLGPRSMLRRPFSIYDTHRDTFSILFKKIGDGTRRLVTYRPSQFLDIIGPLGRGFNIEGETPVLVGGGMGMASLNLLYKRLKEQKINPKVLLGFQSKQDCIDFENAEICTDDGSKGNKGLVTDYLEKEIKSGADVIYTCGPEPMMKKVADVAQENNVKTYVCMERYMACGVGACLSCICETKDGRARVCKEGPIFDSREVFYEKGSKEA